MQDFQAGGRAQVCTCIGLGPSSLTQSSTRFSSTTLSIIANQCLSKQSTPQDVLYRRIVRSARQLPGMLVATHSPANYPSLFIVSRCSYSFFVGSVSFYVVMIVSTKDKEHIAEDIPKCLPARLAAATLLCHNGMNANPRGERRLHTTTYCSKGAPGLAGPHIGLIHTQPHLFLYSPPQCETHSTLLFYGLGGGAGMPRSS